MLSLYRRKIIKTMSLSPLLPGLLSTTALAQPTTTSRQKLEEFVAQPVRLAALKRGVAEMKRRRPSDPTSWFYQGAVHAVSPEAVAAALSADPEVSKVDQLRYWNQCPHFSNQNSADFLIWHRAYIYYFERILRKASGDPTLSLPYWNYTDPTQRGFPEHFADADIDPTTQLPRNPLYDHRREQAFMFGMYELSEGAAGTIAIFRETDFFGATEDTGLAGGVADSNPLTRGRIERQPHDLLHFAIGGAIGIGEVDIGENTAGTMASVQTAAFDPVFWVHHANIDRLWTVWDCLTSPPRQWGNTPPKEWLDAKPWFFNDADGRTANHSRHYYLDRRNLQVSYDSDDTSCKPLSSTPIRSSSVDTVAGTSLLSISPTVRSFVQKAEAGSRLEPGRISPDAPYSIDITLKQLPTELGRNAKNSVLNAPKSAPRRVVLEIEDLKVEGVTSAGFDVYVNLPNEKEPSRDLSAYAGTVSLFGAVPSNSHMHHGHTSSTQRFDISRMAIGDSFDPEKMKVSIVPFDLLVPRSGRPRLRRAVGLTHGRVRILILEGSPNPIM